MNRIGFQENIVVAAVRLLTAWALVTVGATAAAFVSPGIVSAQPDAFGYDYGSRTFSGLYENADRNTANNTGDPTRLRMEWNELYNVSQPELSSPGAWVTYSQRGTYVAGGQTHRWSYSVRLRHTGPGSPIWGYFTADQETYLDAGGGSVSQARPVSLPTSGP